MLLTEIVIKHLLKTPGRFTDSQTMGLHLWVKPNGLAYWIFRFTVNGHRSAICLGAYASMSLKEARRRAIEIRSQLNKGLPTTGFSKRTQNQQVEQGICFDEFAFPYIESMQSKWRNDKHRLQWVTTVRNYASPIVGDMQLSRIDTPHILKILEPIWLKKPETASRLRGRLERILSAATTLKYREGINPASWKGHLENLLPSQRASDAHHAALPYQEIPKFMEELKNAEGVSALALQFTILTASRTGETIGALRSEVVGNIWTIPAQRMKANRQHEVPLCGRALEILAMAESFDPGSEYLFSANGKPLSGMAMLMMVRRLKTGITVHGFRSSFRDWVSEETDHSREAVEMALSHVITNKVEAAYRRGRLLERRRLLMKDWELYCSASHPNDDSELRVTKTTKEKLNHEYQTC